ncbi:MAG: hypothetical protein QUS09_03135, partial [Methanotrichaceae archaeon]|nr:hypothetical protein [Methanotrichaceae archaeon]
MEIAAVKQKTKEVRTIMSDTTSPSEEAPKTDLPAQGTIDSQGDKPAESPKPAGGSTSGAVPESGKPVDLENKVKTLEGLL